jgi:hypothetical protein
LSTWPPGRRTPVASPRTKVRGRPEHPDEYCPKSPILLAVDQELDHLVSSPLITDALRSTSILFDLDVR